MTSAITVNVLATARAAAAAEAAVTIGSSNPEGPKAVLTVDGGSTLI